MMNMPLHDPRKLRLLSVVVPVYNEETTISLFLKELCPVLEVSANNWEIIFVNDGSTDGTGAALSAKLSADARIKVITFSRNFGKEAATSAGLDYTEGDAVILMDADLEHPPSLLPELIATWARGVDVAYAVRRNRNCEPVWKRMGTRLFYWLLNLSNPMPLEPDASDFRIFDRHVINTIRLLPEKGRFMRGLFAWVGFNQEAIPYDPGIRVSGNSKWSPRKLSGLALNAITAFSGFPLRVWSGIGVAISIMAFLYAGYEIGKTTLLGKDLPGYVSTITVVLFLGGIQLIGLGVIGEYLSRIYAESKGRPLYIISHCQGIRPANKTTVNGNSIDE